MSDEIATNPALVELRSVTLRRGPRTLLDRVDLRVGAGERWVLLGPNGAGKTSLMQVASTYELPSSGVASVLGHQLGRVNVWDLRPRIGYSSAAYARLLRPHLTAVEAVVTGAHAAATIFGHTFTDAEWARGRELLADAGLQRLADQRIGALSEGERQGVQLARTLMADPDLLLLDEPTAGLDLAGRERLVTQLGRLGSVSRPQAVLFVTHHVEEIPPGFTHAGLLRAGRLLAAGRIEDVLTASALRDCFDVAVSLERRDGRWLAWA